MNIFKALLFLLNVINIVATVANNILYSGYVLYPARDNMVVICLYLLMIYFGNELFAPSKVKIQVTVYFIAMIIYLCFIVGVNNQIIESQLKLLLPLYLRYSMLLITPLAALIIIWKKDVSFIKMDFKKYISLILVFVATGLVIFGAKKLSEEYTSVFDHGSKGYYVYFIILITTLVHITRCSANFILSYLYNFKIKALKMVEFYVPLVFLLIALIFHF